VEVADVSGDGGIDYNEFVAATLHVSKLEKEENLLRVRPQLRRAAPRRRPPPPSAAAAPCPPACSAHAAAARQHGARGGCACGRLSDTSALCSLVPTDPPPPPTPTPRPQAFKDLDTNGDGTISADELEVALKKFGIADDVHELLKSADTNGVRALWCRAAPGGLLSPLLPPQPPHLISHPPHHPSPSLTPTSPPIPFQPPPPERQHRLL
jgi:hypothetical protein